MSMIKIRPVTKEEIPILEKYLGKKTIPWFHTSKLETQEKGDGLWLVAWKNDVPVSYLQLLWTGPQETEVRKYIKNCAYLKSAGVDEKFQSQGIGSQLIHEAEQLARYKEFKQIGMSVGSTDNPKARRLYERLGYEDWGYGEFTVTWEEIDKNGNKKTEYEVCIFMIKSLA